MSKEMGPSGPTASDNDSLPVKSDSATLGAAGRMRYEEKPIEREPVIQRNEGWDLRDWLSCLIRRKKTILLVGFTVFLAGAMYTALSKPVYRSIALLEIEKESGGSLSNLGDVVSQGVGAPDSEVFATQIQIIRGRTLVEALIDGMRLGEGKEEGPGIFARLTGALKTVVATIFRSLQAPDEAVSDREVLVKGVTGQISAKRDGKSRLIEVSIAAESPQKAQQMLRTHIDNFLRQNLEKRRRIQREAAEWGASEMAAAEKKVVESLTNLVAFTTQHGVVSVDESTNHVLAFFQKKAESLVKSTEQRVQVEALQKEGDARAAAVTAMKSPDADQMYAKLALMESEYAQMRELYSENSPKLVLLRKQIEFFRSRISEQQKETVSAVLDTAKRQEQISQAEFERAKQNALDNKSLNVQYAVLKKEADTNEEIYRTLLQKTKELQVAAQVIGNNIVEIVPPSLPARAVKPKVALNLLIGCFLGLITGLFVAYLQESMDTSVHDSRDLAKASLVNLGMVPNYQQLPKIAALQDGKVKGSRELVILEDPRSALGEAFSLIRTSLFLTYSSHLYRVIMVTSAAPSEGKTFCSVALAKSVAASGKRVLLMEADMRRPRLWQILGHPGGRAGLATGLASQDPDACRNMIAKTSVKGLYLLCSGPHPEDSSRLLGSAAMEKLMKSLRNDFDLILMDAPPIIGLSDARILATHSDGIVFVVKQGHASFDMIASSVAALSGPKCGRILGTIFNQVDVSGSWVASRFGYGYSAYGHRSYRYDYYYRGDGSDRRGRRRKS